MFTPEMFEKIRLIMVHGLLHYTCCHMYVHTVYYIFNMGRRDLPDTYTRAEGNTELWSKGDCKHQENPNRTCYICYVPLPQA